MNIQELEKPLNPEHVVKGGEKKFGPKGDYLEGWHVIAEANRIFGFDGWSYEIALEQNSLTQAKDSNGNSQWQAAYTCVCTVLVHSLNREIKRQDVGFGSGFAKNVGDAIEGATKEAATDALKRALRSFGNQFGLALYDKTRTNVQAPPPPTITDDQRTELMALFEVTGIPVGPILKRASKNTGQPIEDLRDLPEGEFAALKSHLENQTKKEAA